MLSGAGATFPGVLYDAWVREYAATGVAVSYQKIGSGAGIKAITERTVDFGASDAPMTDKQLSDAREPLLHIPMAMGSIVPTYNLPGIRDGLRFTPEVLAGIYLGTIVRWSDSQLAIANPATAFPDEPILTVHRTDGSGTTYAFTNYLSKVSSEWHDRVGFSTSVQWPNGIGGKGNEGVAAAVRARPYSIGYVELIYALQNGLGYGSVRNASGVFVTASLDSTTAAAAGVALTDDLRMSITNSQNRDAYPIATFTWALVYREMPDRPRALATARYLWWAIHEGQRFAKDLGYAPLPAEVIAKAEAQILALTSGGLPVLKR